MYKTDRRHKRLLQLSIYVPIGKLAKPVPFQGTDTGSNPVGGTKYGSVGKLVNPPACHAGDSEFKPRRGRQKRDLSTK